MSGCVSNFQRLLFNSNPNKSGIEIESKKPGRSEREREGGRIVFLKLYHFALQVKIWNP
jgi:hypothetical protein